MKIIPKNNGNNSLTITRLRRQSLLYHAVMDMIIHHNV